MKHSLEKGLGVTTLCGWVLGAALAACSGDIDMAMAPDGSMDGPGEKPQRLTVFFEENCADSQALHESITFTTPPNTLGALPEAPSCEGYVFVGWNTQRDGGGTAFHEHTPVSGNLSVYAQWEALDGGLPRKEPIQLQLHMLSDTFTLTPLKMDKYDESTAVFNVVVSPFEREADANHLELHIAEINGLSFETTSRFDEGTQTFTVTVAYDVEALFEEGFAEIPLRLKNIPDGYVFTELPSLRLPIADGKDKARRIPVHAGNIYAFNAYANTDAGLTLHYKLTEDVKLEAPEEPGGSNWVPIGSLNAYAFSGSFDGGGHTLKGLAIYSHDRDNQGLFGRIAGEGTVVENVVLTDLSVLGNQGIGGLVGMNNATIRNSHVAGSVSGNNATGGLAGWNEGSVQNSYAAGSVKGRMAVGGLLGASTGSVQNSYATAHVEGDRSAGGLVGWNEGSVQNNYATGSVTGNVSAGGLVGENSKRVENNVALNASIRFARNDDSHMGRVLGYNVSGELENNYARDDMVLTSDAGNSNTPYVPSPAPDGNDGADVTAEEYGTKEFWEELGFDFAEDWAWNASTRLPILREVGGAQGHLVPPAVH